MNQETTRLVALLLGATLIVVIAVTLIVVLLRPPQPGPIPSGSVGPSPSVPASFGPSPSIEPSPTESATTSPNPSPSPTPTPTPTPTPVPTPNAPERDVTFVNLGTDASDDPDAMARVLNFNAAANSGILITVSDIVGANKVRLCTWRGDYDHVAARQCQNMGNDETVARTVGEAGTWSVSVLGRPGKAATLSLDLAFFAKKPTLTLNDFRLDGTEDPFDPDYNGLTLELTALKAGNINVSASMHHFEGGVFNWQLDYTNIDTSSTQTYSGGPSSSMTNSYAVGAITNWRVRLWDPDAYPGPRPITLRGTISWP